MGKQRPRLVCWLPGFSGERGGGLAVATLSWWKMKVKLKCSDDRGEDKMLEVDKAVTQESQILKNLIEDIGIEHPILLPNVTHEILAKVIEYCEYHVEALKATEEEPAAVDDKIKCWDEEFVKALNKATLFGLINAASDLHIKKLLDLISKTLADMIKGKSIEEMRTFFNIKNDFTPEEEKAMKEQYLWAF